MQIKTTMRYHYTPIRMDKIRNNESIKCYKGYEEMSHSYTSDSIKLYSHSGDYFGILWKNERYTSHKVQQLDSCSVMLEKWKLMFTQKQYVNAQRTSIHNNWTLKTTQTSFNGWIFRQIIIYPCYRILLSIIKK